MQRLEIGRVRFADEIEKKRDALLVAQTLHRTARGLGHGGMCERRSHALFENLVRTLEPSGSSSAHGISEAASSTLGSVSTTCAPERAKLSASSTRNAVKSPDSCRTETISADQRPEFVVHAPSVRAGQRSLVRLPHIDFEIWYIHAASPDLLRFFVRA